jgi:hypothetical protein
MLSITHLPQLVVGERDVVSLAWEKSPDELLELALKFAPSKSDYVLLKATKNNHLWEIFALKESRCSNSCSEFLLAPNPSPVLISFTVGGVEFKSINPIQILPKGFFLCFRSAINFSGTCSISGPADIDITSPANLTLQFNPPPNVQVLGRLTCNGLIVSESTVIPAQSNTVQIKADLSLVPLAGPCQLTIGAELKSFSVQPFTFNAHFQSKYKTLLF